jgi:hypothetical protein
MDNQIYNDKPLSSYSLWDLGKVYQSLKEAEAKREEASKHPKFDTKNNKKAIPFPPTNPNFLKLKDAIEAEIRKKQNVI